MSIARVYYRERQRLSTADLRLEQSYRLDAARRHNLGHHDWGVVRGLRVVKRNGGVTITPGIAIDGYGRELVVADEIDISTDKLLKEGRYIFLVWCEDWEPTKRQGCSSETTRRVRQRPKERLANEFLASPSLAEGVLQASETLAPWPVHVATIGSTNVASYAQTTYVGHRAGSIRSPTTRALFQLGLRDRRDSYHALVSTRDGAAQLTRRLGIDRDGVLHVWRPLVVALTSIEDSEGKTVSVTKSEGDVGWASWFWNLIFGEDAERTVEIQTNELPSPRGGKLILRAKPETIKELASKWPALVFKPALKIEPSEAAREIYAARSETRDGTIIDLALCGGAADDNDPSGRLSVGIGGGENYVPILRLGGEGQIELLADMNAEGEKVDPLLVVKGRVGLPPIGKNDPALRDLQMLATAAGLIAKGKVDEGVIKVSDPKKDEKKKDEKEEEGADKKPDVAYYNIDAPDATQIIELITSTSGQGEMSIRLLDIATINSIALQVPLHLYGQAIRLRAVAIFADEKKGLRANISEPKTVQPDIYQIKRRRL